MEKIYKNEKLFVNKKNIYSQKILNLIHQQ